MILGIVGIIIGAIWYIHSFMFNVDSAPQQTVQYLGFVCGSIFIVGGMILLKLQNSTKLQNNFFESKNQSNNINEQKWKCPKCNNSNPNSTFQCEKCGYKLN